jgi:hypothetical protein
MLDNEAIGSLVCRTKFKKMCNAGVEYIFDT